MSNIEFGVNLIGNFQEYNGIYSLMNHVSHILEIKNIPFKLINIIKSEELFYHINIIINNAQGWNWTPQSLLKGHYNIAIWSWELDTFPDIWCSLPNLDEVWTISQFLYPDMALKIKQKVRWFNFYSFNEPEFFSESDIKKFKAKYNIENNFTFLYIFDAHSVTERKNPHQLTQVFTEFKKDKNISLIIKINNIKDDLSYIKNIPGCYLITDVLEEKEMQLLYQSSHVYISPHTTEGLGYTIFEAIENNIPVIATDYGGFKDIITEFIPLKGEMVDVNNSVYKGKWMKFNDEELYNKMKYVTENYEDEKKKVSSYREKLKINNFDNLYRILSRIYFNILNRHSFENYDGTIPDIEFYRLSSIDLLDHGYEELKIHLKNQAFIEKRIVLYKKENISIDLWDDVYYYLNNNVPPEKSLDDFITEGYILNKPYNYKSSETIIRLQGLKIYNRGNNKKIYHKILSSSFTHKDINVFSNIDEYFLYYEFL